MVVCLSNLLLRLNFVFDYPFRILFGLTLITTYKSNYTKLCISAHCKCQTCQPPKGKKM